MNNWTPATIGEAFDVNPRRTIIRGTVAPFVPMDALMEHQRAITRFESREFSNGGSRFKNGDTVVARITPCLENGKTAYLSSLPEGVVAHGSTEFVVLAARPGLTDGLFAYYLARSDAFRNHAISRMEGTSGRQRVPTSAIERFVIQLPPLLEQRRIASVLGQLGLR